MTGPELGLLLLCCRLEDEVLPLTQAQYRALRQQMRQCPAPENSDRALCAEDLQRCGCVEAERILALLSRRRALLECLPRWEAAGVLILTRLSPHYPAALRAALGDDAPPALFLSGDASLLSRPMLSLTGCRDLYPEGAAFAAQVGAAAARTGHVLVSGNARGADRIAQEACLAAGGAVLSFVADRLTDHSRRARVLYVSEDGPDRPFSAARALARNRCIYALGRPSLVAQVRDGQGGTWRGASQALARGKRDLYLLRDGSSGAQRLCDDGAQTVLPEQLDDLLRFIENK
ncbi:MAG: DNA-processing protein DprA [Oscillospiraceae bacterium]|nr:DNA-processing protein DprA [Oscillospiraceae bacterium]